MFQRRGERKTVSEGFTFISGGNYLQIPVKSSPWLFAEEFQPIPIHTAPPKSFAIKGAGWISQLAIITSGDMRARRCVRPVVLDEIRRDYTAIDKIIRPPLLRHTHTPPPPPHPSTTPLYHVWPWCDHILQTLRPDDSCLHWVYLTVQSQSLHSL